MSPLTSRRRDVGMENKINRSNSTNIYRKQDLKSLKSALATAKKGRSRTRIRVTSLSPRKLKIKRKPLVVLSPRRRENSKLGSIEHEVVGEQFSRRKKQRDIHQQKYDQTVAAVSPRRITVGKVNSDKENTEPHATADFLCLRVSSTSKAGTTIPKVTLDNRKESRIARMGKKEGRCNLFETSRNSGCLESHNTEKEKTRVHQNQSTATAN